MALEYDTLGALQSQIPQASSAVLVSLLECEAAVSEGLVCPKLLPELHRILIICQAIQRPLNRELREMALALENSIKAIRLRLEGISIVAGDAVIEPLLLIQACVERKSVLSQLIRLK